MSRFLKRYVPALSIAFTIIILYATVSNIIEGYLKEGFCIFVLEVAAYLFITIIADQLICKIDFKKYIHYYIAETIILYPITIGISVIGKWFSTDLFHIIWFSCVYVIITAVVHYYFYYVSKEQADEINAILQRRQRE